MLKQQGSLVLFAALLFPLLPTKLRAAVPPEPTRVTWKDARVEDALEAVDQAGIRLSILCDSDLDDPARSTCDSRIGTPEQALTQIAREYRRQLLRSESHRLLRDQHWYAPKTTVQTASSGRRTLAQRTLIQASGTGVDAPLKVNLLRAPLSAIGDELRRATGSRHFISLPLRTRRVTGKIDRTSPSDFRRLVTQLFPDTEWKREQGRWYLQLRPNAEFIRKVAEDCASHEGEEMIVPAALYTQAAGELTSAQMEQLRLTGKVSLGWAGLTPASRNVLRRRAELLLPDLDRDKLPPNFHPDLSQVTSWSVEFLREGKTGFKVQTRALNSAGAPVFYY